MYRPQISLKRVVKHRNIKEFEISDNNLFILYGDNKLKNLDGDFELIIPKGDLFLKSHGDFIFLFYKSGKVIIFDFKRGELESILYKEKIIIKTIVSIANKVFLLSEDGSLYFTYLECFEIQKLNFEMVKLEEESLKISICRELFGENYYIQNIYGENYLILIDKYNNVYKYDNSIIFCFSIEIEYFHLIQIDKILYVFDDKILYTYFLEENRLEKCDSSLFNSFNTTIYYSLHPNIPINQVLLERILDDKVIKIKYNKNYFYIQTQDGLFEAENNLKT